MSRHELADAVNAILDRLTATDRRARPHINTRWITELERGEHRRPKPDLELALCHVLVAAADKDLGLSHPIHREP